MSRRRSFVIALVSAVLSGTLIYGIYLLQIKQIEWQETVNVAVPKYFLDAGTLIAADMVEYKAIYASTFDERMYTNIEEILGQETLIPIGKGEPILNWKINRYNLLPKRNESTFQIPKSYILSISNQIRAGDYVYVYLSSGDGNSRRLFETPITVASVKMASNQEVDNTTHSSLLSRARGDLEMLYVSRRNANGPIDAINLNLTEDQWLTIDRLCKFDENKLVIAFSNARMQLASDHAEEGEH